MANHEYRATATVSLALLTAVHVQYHFGG